MSELFSCEASDLLSVERGDLLFSPEPKPANSEANLLPAETKPIEFSPPSSKDTFQRLRCKYQSALSSMNSNMQVKSTKHRRRQSFAIAQMLDSVTSIASTPLKMSSADTERLVETMRKSTVKRRISVLPRSCKKSRAQTLRRVSKNIDEIFASHFAEDELEESAFLIQSTPHHQSQHISKKKVISLVDRFEDDPVLSLIGGSPIQASVLSDDSQASTPKLQSTCGIIVTSEDDSVVTPVQASSVCTPTAKSGEKSQQKGMQGSAFRLRDQNFTTSNAKTAVTPTSTVKKPHMVARKPPVPHSVTKGSTKGNSTPTRVATPKSSARSTSQTPAYYTAPSSQPRPGFLGTPQRMGSAVKATSNRVRLVPSSATKTTMHSVQLSVEKLGALMQSMKKNDDNNNRNNRNAALSVSRSRGCTPSMNTAQKKFPSSVAKALEFGEYDAIEDNACRNEVNDNLGLVYELNPDDSLIMDAVLSLDLTFHDEDDNEEELDDASEQSLDENATELSVGRDNVEIEDGVATAEEEHEFIGNESRQHSETESTMEMVDQRPVDGQLEASGSAECTSDADSEIPDYITVLKFHDIDSRERSISTSEGDLGVIKKHEVDAEDKTNSVNLSGYGSDSSCSPQIVRVRYSAGSAARRSLSNTRGRISLGNSAAEGSNREAPTVAFSAPVCKAAVYYAPPNSSSPNRALPGTVKAAASSPRYIAQKAVRLLNSSPRTTPPISSPNVKAATGLSKTTFVPRNKAQKLQCVLSDSDSSSRAPMGVLATTGKMNSRSNMVANEAGSQRGRKSLGNISVANLLKRFQAQAHAKAAMMSPVNKSVTTVTTPNSFSRTSTSPASPQIKNSSTCLQVTTPVEASVAAQVNISPCVTELPVSSSPRTVRVTRSSSKLTQSAGKIISREIRSPVSSSVSTPTNSRSIPKTQSSVTYNKVVGQHTDDCASLRKAAQEILNDIGSETPFQEAAGIAANTNEVSEPSTKEISGPISENNENVPASVINAQASVPSAAPASILKSVKNRRKSAAPVTRSTAKPTFGEQEEQDTTTKKYSLRSSRKSVTASIPAFQQIDTDTPLDGGKQLKHHDNSIQSGNIAKDHEDLNNTARALFSESLITESTSQIESRTPTAKGRRASVATFGKTPVGGYTAAKAKRTARNQKLDELFVNCDELLNMIDATVQ